MLKAIVALECDICREFFDHVVISTDRGPKAWWYLTGELERLAEQRGWNLYRNTQHCETCQHDMMFIAQQRVLDEYASADEEF